MFYCGFESDFCGMDQLFHNKYNWTLNTGSTTTLDTGPEAAVSGESYIYVEASDIANSAIVR